MTALAAGIAAGFAITYPLARAALARKRHH